MRKLFLVLGLLLASAPLSAQEAGRAPSAARDRVYLLSMPAFGDGDPLNFAVKMIKDPAGAERSMTSGLLAIFGRDDILAARNFKALIEEIRARGYEIVVVRSPSRQDFFRALEDPRTVGILHEGHFAVTRAEVSPDGKTRARFIFKAPDGGKEYLNVAEINEYVKMAGRRTSSRSWRSCWERARRWTCISRSGRGPSRTSRMGSGRPSGGRGSRSMTFRDLPFSVLQRTPLKVRRRCFRAPTR